MTYEYYINLDERGEFEADVRDADGTTVFEFNGEFFEDGWMDSKNDVVGLNEYLRTMQIIPNNSRTVAAN